MRQKFNMEVILLYWDNLDDLLGALRLLGETLRRWLIRALQLILVGSAAVGIGLAAVHEPPLALAALTSVFVAVFYRRVTGCVLRTATA
ncbi:MAG: hypothetical protein AAFX56_03185 [Pseudomonadota bacterium]